VNKIARTEEGNTDSKKKARIGDTMYQGKRGGGRNSEGEKGGDVVVSSAWAAEA